MAAFWDSCPPATRATLEECGRTREFKRGAVLCYEADELNDVIVIRSGLAKISRLAANGREVILDLADQGEILGELTAIDPEPCSATVSLLTDSRVLLVPMGAFRRLMESDPALCVLVLDTIAGRLRGASQRQLEFGAGDALARLAGSLVRLADRFGTTDSGSTQVILPVAQHDLAALAGLSREAIVKGLRTMRLLGWIAVEGRTVQLLDESAVRACSEI